MNEILNQISRESINYYIESNLDDFYTKSSEHSNFFSQLEDKISWVFAKKGDWPNCIFRANRQALTTSNAVF